MISRENRVQCSIVDLGDGDDADDGAKVNAHCTKQVMQIVWFVIVTIECGASEVP
jgi:hypothetical protein